MKQYIIAILAFCLVAIGEANAQRLINVKGKVMQIVEKRKDVPPLLAVSYSVLSAASKAASRSLFRPFDSPHSQNSGNSSFLQATLR